MENIERLQKIPIELLKAQNVTWLVIDGFRLEKKMIIGKAKNDAYNILQYDEFLSNEGRKYLQEILKL